MALSDNITFLLLLRSAGVLLAARIFFNLVDYAISSRKLPYPPGPPPASIIFGNKTESSKKKTWVTYAEMGKIYGDIIHLQNFGQHTIILNSIEVVKDLIERRPHIYSDRPDVTMVKLMEWDFATGFIHYGPDWRIHRRLFNQMFRPAAVTKYRPLQTKKVTEFLYALLTTPEDFEEHSKNVPGGIIMSAMYGYDIAPKGDYFVHLAETGVMQVSMSVFPGAIIANALPFVRYIPSWFPGAGFKRFAEEAKSTTRQLRDVPFEFARRNMAEGTGTPCIVSELLTKLDKSFLDKHMQLVKDMAATGYAAAADTTTSSILTFFYAMAMYPDVQKKAQEEIDNVVGSERLVTFDDRASLPYVEAIYREVMRWQPVTPLGLAHSTSEDDIYKGFYIPKGTTVFANVWALSHDPEKYKSPEAFHPDRHFDDHGKLLSGDDIYGYGFGRRICAGRYMASSTLWLTIAAALSVFDIGKKKDANGNYIPLDVEYTDTLISHPSPFECLISPRSEEATQLIKGCFQMECRRAGD